MEEQHHLIEGIVHSFQDQQKQLYQQQIGMGFDQQFHQKYSLLEVQQ
jgi:hypothetical protein